MEIMGGVILMECDNTLPHKAHSWRERFRKHTCKGVTPEQFDIYMERKWPKPKQVEPHKHRFEYKPSQKHLWVNPDRYVWICKDRTCDHVISTDKEEFRGALLHQGKTHIVKLPPRRRSWRSN